MHSQAKGCPTVAGLSSKGSADKHAHPTRLRADHCRADEPVRWSQSSDLGAPLVFPGQAAVPLTNNRYRRLRRPFAARSLGRQCCRAAMRSSRALDAVPRHRARACGLPVTPSGGGDPETGNRPSRSLSAVDDGDSTSVHPRRCWGLASRRCSHRRQLRGIDLESAPIGQGRRLGRVSQR